MTYSLRFSNRFLEEMRAIHRWYTNGGGATAALLLQIVGHRLDKLKLQPQAFGQVQGESYQRIFLDPFPYAIYFRKTANSISINRCVTTFDPETD